MKKIIYAAMLCGSLTLSFSACNSFLDVKPVAEKPGDLDTKTVEGITGFLNGAYDRMQSGDYISSIRVAEMYADNIDFAKAAGAGLDAWEGEFANYNFSIFNRLGQPLWDAAYQCISRANVVIDATDKNSYTAEQNVKNRLKGEALVLRAMTHFNLVTLFALPASAGGSNPGIILRSVPITTIVDASVKVDRASVDAVYTDVIKDLTQAITLLQQASNAPNPNRITATVAQALLARVYFNRLDYANAYTQADAVIKSNAYKMNTPTDAGMTGMFAAVGDGKAPDGVIFQCVNMSLQDDASGTLRDNFYINKNAPNENVQKYPLANPLIATMTGKRRDLLTRTTGGTTFTTKYAQLNNGTVAVNIPLIRLAEMYLIRAEAGLETNRPVTEARNDLNVVRVAAQGTTDNATSDSNALKTIIRNERRAEFAAEGDRWNEVRRLKVTNIRNNVGFDNKKGLMKIPDSETKGNPNITQN